MCPSHENYFSLVYVHMEPAFAQFLLEDCFCFLKLFLFDFRTIELKKKKNLVFGYLAFSKASR